MSCCQTPKNNLFIACQSMDVETLDALQPLFTECPLLTDALPPHVFRCLGSIDGVPGRLIFARKVNEHYQAQRDLRLQWEGLSSRRTKANKAAKAALLEQAGLTRAPSLTKLSYSQAAALAKRVTTHTHTHTHTQQTII
jgi:hypothetical protein